MTKENLIALADAIRPFPELFGKEATDILAAFCKSQRPHFNTANWLAYISGDPRYKYRQL